MNETRLDEPGEAPVSAGGRTYYPSVIAYGETGEVEAVHVVATAEDVTAESAAHWAALGREYDLWVWVPCNRLAVAERLCEKVGIGSDSVDQWWADAGGIHVG